MNSEWNRLRLVCIKGWLNKMKVTNCSIFMQLKYSPIQSNSLMISTRDQIQIPLYFLCPSNSLDSHWNEYLWTALIFQAGTNLKTNSGLRHLHNIITTFITKQLTFQKLYYMYLFQAKYSFERKTNICRKNITSVIFKYLHSDRFIFERFPVGIVTLFLHRNL